MQFWYAIILFTARASLCKGDPYPSYLVCYVSGVRLSYIVSSLGAPDRMLARTTLLAMTATAVVAQDPADGWMAYAVGTIPDQAERITRLEMTWKVGEEPKHSFAFFSPWFGMGACCHPRACARCVESCAWRAEGCE